MCRYCKDPEEFERKHGHRCDECCRVSCDECGKDICLDNSDEFIKVGGPRTGFYWCLTCSQEFGSRSPDGAA